jgi:hypothetical protein
MALLKINWHPTRKQLGDFGKIALVATALISLLLWAIKDVGFKWTLPILAVGLIIFVASKTSENLA